MSQIIIRGLEKIKPFLENRKILLVRDGAYEHLKMKAFFDTIEHAEFSDITPNPLYEQVCRGIEIFNQEQCEAIVAVGGGSIIDAAKCIKLYCRMNHNINYLEQDSFDTGVPLIAVPTTAGTGSESTCHAVIYLKGIKQSISHASIIPDIAVLEPSVLKTLPVYQKKCTLLDALCQAIESWWSVGSTDESKMFSRRAVGMIRDNWEEYIYENTASSAEKIMEAANFAGCAINITATTAAHAMSYKVTSLYNLPHGHAVAVCMPQVWEYILEHTDDCMDERGTEYLKATLKQISEMLDLSGFNSILEKMGISSPVASHKEDEVIELTRSVNTVRLKNNPVALSTDVLKEMYRRIIIE